MNNLGKVVIDRIEKNDDNTDVNLYGPSKPGSRAEQMFGEFRIAASREQASNLHVGDEIEYESMGVNLAFFVRKL